MVGKWNQYIKTFCNFDAQAIWRAHAEGKHRFFAWLLVKEKILTADKAASKELAL